MSHSEKIIAKLNNTQRNRLENFRKILKKAQTYNEETRAKSQISCYLRGLTDANAITEPDFRTLFIYYTI